MFDPMRYLREQDLTLFSLIEGKYRRHESSLLGETGLGLVLWEGEFEGVTNLWLRWQDSAGHMLLTGQERAAAESLRAAALAAKLRELGVDPDSIA